MIDPSKYTLNSTVINNCPGTYYEHAMVNLWQKQDGSGETAGSNALLTRDKRLRSFLESVGNPHDSNHTGGAARLPSKQAMIRLATPYAAADFGNFEQKESQKESRRLLDAELCVSL